MGHSRPLFDYFRSFIITISIIQIEKKKRWCARDSNPGPQNSRRRQNHVGCGGHHSVKCLKNWAICGIFFFIFVLFHTVDSTNTFFKWLHSNRWPLGRKQPLYQFARTTSVKVFLRQSSSRFVFVISANVGQRIPVVQQLDIFGRARSLRPQLCPLVLHEREQMLPKRVQHKGLLGLLVPSKCPFKKFPILAKAVAKLCNLWENDI